MIIKVFPSVPPSVFASIFLDILHRRDDHEAVHLDLQNPMTLGCYAPEYVLNAHEVCDHLAVQPSKNLFGGSYLDEPTSNIDVKKQLEALDTVTSIVKKTGILAVMVIHDLNLAAGYSDNLVMLKKGKALEIGDPLSQLTKENIRSIFDVEVAVITDLDRPYVNTIKYLSGES